MQWVDKGEEYYVGQVCSDEVGLEDGVLVVDQLLVVVGRGFVYVVLDWNEGGVYILLRLVQYLQGMFFVGMLDQVQWIVLILIWINGGVGWLWYIVGKFWVF